VIFLRFAREHTMAEPHSRDLQVVVVTPERALFDQRADFVAIPMHDGELGVLPGRAALIGRLGFGELRIRKGPATTYLYVEGGFVQVRNNVVSVLTSRALKPEEIRPDAVRQALESAQSAQNRAAGTEAQEAQLVAQDRARAQLRVAKHRQEATA
jgi:F-type H+-transporting ATPase subunit epsilon